MMTSEQKRGQNGIVETMRVVANSPSGYVVINKDDFNAAEQKEYVGPDASTPKAEGDEQSAAAQAAAAALGGAGWKQ